MCLVASACTCRSNVGQIAPSIAVAPTIVDFGDVKNGDRATRTLTLESRSQAPVLIGSVTLEAAGSAPGGLESFGVGTPPPGIEGFGQGTLTVSFSPLVLQAYAANVLIGTNDPERPIVRVPLLGVGAKPILEVTPECLSARGCTGTAVEAPPSIDFAPEPFMRALAVDPSTLPTVNVVNAGPVALKVTKASFEGIDAAAFSFAGNSMFPAEGLTLEAAEGVNLQIQFKPTSEAKSAYSALLAIESDDVDHPRITVGLTGTLRPNAGPVVCANLVRVTPPPQGDAPRDYGSAAQWAPLLVAPAAGYDFTTTRDVRPGELAAFSALSDSSSMTACTSDPEDGRTGLTYLWRVVTQPAGAPPLALSGAATAQVQLRPVATGTYVLELSVKDAQQKETLVRLTFAVAIKQDLVVQLQWPGFADVDLDVHLVRPSASTGPADPFSGVFSFFEAGASQKTAGDINGYAATVQRSMSASGFDFDWGNAGSSDDPKLNLDDTGNGPLIENVSLNFPENDAACATASCTYKVMVHYFRDQRSTTAAACVVDGGVGCLDGESCSCVATERCVADSAPASDAGTGAGKCHVAPKPVVRIYVRGSPTPAAIVPLDTLVPADALVLGAPCQTLYVADVAWPARTAIGTLADGGSPPPVITVKGADGTGRITSPLLGRFGIRQTGGSLTCSPDTSVNGVQWYSRRP
ncbi:MAG: choice-of-anchor D domain-containing protein [Archangium sp.]|nr:choice-of-anchor D domain-containing protein [Archangium sp.]